MRTFLDIDDTLTYPSPYQNFPNKDPFTNTPEFGNRLLEAPLAPFWKEPCNRLWLQDMIAGDPVYYVTGRQPQWEQVTRAWIEKMSFPKGEFMFLNYTTWDKYLMDKIVIISKNSGSGCNLIIDDNYQILDKLKNILTGNLYFQMLDGIKIFKL